MACLHAVSLVRRHRIPRTECDDSTAYGHTIIAVNVASRTRARLQGRPTVASGAAAGGRCRDLTERVGGESGRRAGRNATSASSLPLVRPPQRALLTSKTHARTHARQLAAALPALLRRPPFAIAILLILNHTRPPHTAGHALLAVNIASRTRARLQDRATVVSGAVAGGRVGGCYGARRWARADVGGVVCTHQFRRPPSRLTTPAGSIGLEDLRARPSGPRTSSRPCTANRCAGARFPHHHGVSFVRRCHIPCTQRDESTAYGHAFLALNMPHERGVVCKTLPPSLAAPQQEGESFVIRERVGGPERT
ncbi:uncharacterized protein LAESUDRAFT_765196 [Laetiporus sulphureus 93-53]|uniref:Uncharacterized protein n=1 Tax=Laetiporus sulphureus 93-53 TaxID=1314785 RepID=A0A165AWG2_9APHY|nr:uncharacterized protein LAESUDRAFT_765196 [Laetiporus sulphureus 93-53]KZS99787.1 hypothetical protein LAESUDRAFT_765196 [Laetiporus sulphureus 93-53]